MLEIALFVLSLVALIWWEHVGYNIAMRRLIGMEWDWVHGHWRIYGDQGKQS